MRRSGDMDCGHMKKLIPIYLDGELQPKEAQEAKQHLASCPGCQERLRGYEESWAMLGSLGPVSPDPGFVGRFWTRVAQERSWRERWLVGFKEGVFKKRLAPAFVTVLSILMIGSFAVRNYLYIQKTNQKLARLSTNDIAVVENLEWLENFEVIKDIDFLADLDVLEQMSGPGLSSATQ